MIGHPPTTSPAAESASESERPWPALMAFLTAGLFPAATARRTEHVSLRGAYAVHFLSALTVFAVISLLVAWEDAPQPATWRDVGSGVGSMTGGLAWELSHIAPGTAFAAVAGTVLSIEGGYLLMAVFLAPWGAADEPIRASLRSAIHRAWLHTPHILLVVLLAGLLSVPLFRAQEASRRAVSDQLEPLRSAQPPDWRAYDEARREAWGQYPIYIRHAEGIATIGWFAGAAWWVWGLLGSIGAPRRITPITRPAICEMCGYNLTGIALEGRCPECGEPAIGSLGPEVRPGTLWERRRQVGRWRAWWRCTVDAITRPVWFGRQLKTSAPATGHRRFLAVHVPVVFVVGYLGVIGCFVAATGRNPFVSETEVAWAIGPIAGFICAAGILFLAAAAAGLIGIRPTIKPRRNLMAGSMQAACYLSGYLVVWTAFAFILLAALIDAEGSLRGFARLLSLDKGLLIFAAWLLPNLACFGLYLRLVAWVTAATRYANR